MIKAFTAKAYPALAPGTQPVFALCTHNHWPQARKHWAQAKSAKKTKSNWTQINADSHR